MKLKNKVALITGAAVGIGKATAIVFAEQGAKLVLIDVNGKKLDALKKELEVYTKEVLTVVCDVTDEALAFGQKQFLNLTWFKCNCRKSFNFLFLCSKGSVVKFPSFVCYKANFASHCGKSFVSIVLTQIQAVFAAACHHAVRVHNTFCNKVINKSADVA